MGIITADKITSANFQPSLANGIYTVRNGHWNRLIDDVTDHEDRITAIEAGAGHVPSALDCSTDPNYPASTNGNIIYVTVAGHIGGAAGPAVEVGDMVFCIADSAAGTHAAVGANFDIVQKNMIPCTVAVLQTGTNNTDFVSAKTLKDAGMDFGAATLVSLAGGTGSQLVAESDTGDTGATVTFNAFDRTVANDILSIGGSKASATGMDGLHITMNTSNAMLGAEIIRGIYTTVTDSYASAVTSILTGHEVLVQATDAVVGLISGIKTNVEFATTSATTVTGMYITCGSSSLSNAAANFYGLNIDISSYVTAVGGANDVYGIRVIPSADVDAGMYIGGSVVAGINVASTATNGIVLSGAFTTGLTVTGTSTTGISVTGASTTGIAVSGGTTSQIAATATAAQYGIDIQHTAATTSSLNIFTGVNSATVNVVDITAYPSAALTAGEIVTGVHSHVDSNGSDADTAAYAAYDAIATATTAGRADNMCYVGSVIGDRTTADTDQGVLISFGNGVTDYNQNSTSCQAYGIRIAAQAGATYHAHTLGQWYGLHINKTSVMTPSATETSTGIYVAGTYTNAIDLRGAVPAYETYGAAESGTRNHPFINAGSWDSPIALTPTLDHFAAIQVNIQNGTAAYPYNFAAMRLRADTAIASTANHYGLQIRNAIAHDVASAYGLNASMNVSAIAIGTGAMAVGSFYLEGTGAITPAGVNPIDVVNITNVHSGTGVSNCLNVCNNTASALDAATGGSVTVISNLSGPVTDMLYLNNANTATYGLRIAGAYTSALSLGTTGTPLALNTAGGADRAFNLFSTSSLATASTVTSATIKQTMTGASAVNSAEALNVTLSSAIQMGNWANAICAKIDLTTTGYVTGLAGVVCAELDMPTTGPAGSTGTYTCFEAEINMAGTTNVPVSAITVNAWGASVADFDDYGYLFDINGVTKATTHIFQDNNNTATQALRIRVNGTPYYILLSDTSD